MFKKSGLLIIAALLVLAGIFWVRLFSKEDSWVCENNSWVKHGNPAEQQPQSGCGPEVSDKVEPPVKETATNTVPSSSPEIVTPDVIPTNLSVDGMYVCLPKRGDGPQTLECALGLLADDGKYYSLDTNRLGTYIEYPTGSRLHIDGIFTPIEMISSNLGKIYDVRGIITVLTVEEID